MSQNNTLLSGTLARASQLAAHYADHARSKRTRTLYARQWEAFMAWCARADAPALPAAPATIAAWLADLAHQGRSLSAINVALSAVLAQHRAAGHTLKRAHPVIAAVLGGIARRCARPHVTAAPLDLDTLRLTVSAIDGADLRALRDRAVILLGFWAALRRSEIAALDVGGRSGVRIVPQGLIVQLTATKTSAETQTIAVPRRTDALCAVDAVQRYLAAANPSRGPVFRAISKAGRLLDRRLNAASVTHILKTRLGANAGRFSAHSLRAGFITAAAEGGAPEHMIARTSRHKSVAVLRGYIRSGDAFAAAAGRFIG